MDGRTLTNNRICKTDKPLHQGLRKEFKNMNENHFKAMFLGVVVYWIHHDHDIFLWLVFITPKKICRPRISPKKLLVFWSQQGSCQPHEQDQGIHIGCEWRFHSRFTGIYDGSIWGRFNRIQWDYISQFIILTNTWSVSRFSQEQHDTSVCKNSEYISQFVATCHFFPWILSGNFG